MEWRERNMPVFEISQKSKEIRDKFFEQYVEFYKGGDVPEYASSDFSYYLECHRKRLEEKGITAVKKVENIADNIDSQVQKGNPPYTLNMTYKECNYETDYMKGDVLLARSDKETETLYCNILDKQDYVEETISCPNCGHSEGVRSFVNGCPMCGTRFKTFKFFPCVTSFHTLPKFVERNKINNHIRYTFIGAVILGIIVAFITGISTAVSSESILFGIFAGFFAGLGAGFIGWIMIYFTYSIFLAITTFSKMFAQAVDTTDLQAAQLTKKRLVNDMNRYFSDFSYEYFEGKLISLLRSIIFSDDRENLSILKCTENLDYMDDIIDVEYRGASKYEGCTLVGDVLHVRMTAYVVCVVYKNDKFSRHQVAFRMEVVTRLKKQEDLGFSIHAVNCRTCGATFDAMHVDKCPHCGNPYNIIDDDWVVIYLQSSVNKQKEKT